MKQKSIKIQISTHKRLKTLRDELTIINFEKFTFDQTLNFLLEVVERRLKESKA